MDHGTQDRFSSDHNAPNDDENSRNLLSTDPANQDDRASETSIEEDDSLVKNKPIPSYQKCYLHRSAHALILFGVYAVLATFTWIMICILNFRPVTTPTYGPNMDLYKVYPVLDEIRALYIRNDNVFQAVTIFQAVVAVLTIPVASAICTAAAVIFTQRNWRSSRMTLRQLMMLADKGWTDVELLSKMGFTGWKRYGSSLLAVAIFVHLLGGLLAPLQQYFLSEVTIQTPTVPQYVKGVCDIPEHFRFSPTNTPHSDDNAITVIARSLMASTSSVDVQSRLWYGNPPSCNATGDPVNVPQEEQAKCSAGGAILAYLSSLDDPFVAQLSSGYDTGFATQYIPRINSTATVHANSEEASFPPDCETGDNFYVSYSNSSGSGGKSYDIAVCMPGNQKQSPWKKTKRRQDFSETLYLKINTSLSNLLDSYTPSTYRVVLNTTAGYFELPNIWNSEPGPLLSEGPPDALGEEYENDELPPGISKAKRQSTSNSSTQLSLESVVNKGPLLTTAMALFGEGSFIANRAYHPEFYLASKFYQSLVPGPSYPLDESHKAWHCAETVPMARLLQPPGEGDFNTQLTPCVTNYYNSTDDLIDAITQYATMFQLLAGDLQNAFNAAAFLANEAWLTNLYNGDQCDRYVQYDLGAPSQKPSISITGIAVISVLLILYLGCLFAIAMYSYSSPRWTSQLSSLAMIRIGAAMADEIPLEVNVDDSKLTTLDRTPGFIGDAPKGPGDLREIGLGFQGRLSMRKPYYLSCGS